MSAITINLFTAIVPNASWVSGVNVKQFTYANTSISYSRPVWGFVTLSANNPNDYTELSGLLYVPLLAYPYTATNIACGNTSAFSVPANVTNLSSLPPKYPRIAIFPWTTPECAKAYLAQSSVDDAWATITFQPTAGNTTPPATDTSWRISDNSPWEQSSPIPVYAINSQDGSDLITHLSFYSGSMSAAPFGDQLTQQYSSTDLPRIWLNIDLHIYNSDAGISTWAVLLLILAMLFAIAILTSIAVKVARRRNRRSFQERLQRGEIDLEALGIKKTNVPQEMIDKMPIFPFRASPKHSHSQNPTAGLLPPDQQKDDSFSPPARSADETFSSFSQPACPVCLDDFVHGETNVRELPCKHIFHPECIDLYLHDTSSLCPMCKTSALPVGYCPVKVTNIMVRRERLTRRIQERARSEAAAAEARASVPSIATQTVQGVASGQVEMTTLDSNSETTLTQTDDHYGIPAMPAEVAAQGAPARRAWHRERLARQQQQVFAEASENARLAEENRSLWRRTVGRLIPSLA